MMIVNLRVQEAIKKGEIIKKRLESTPGYVPDVHTPLGWISPDNVEWLLGVVGTVYPYPEAPKTPYLKMNEGIDIERYGEFTLCGEWKDLAKRLDCAIKRKPGLTMDKKITFIRHGVYKNVQLDFSAYLSELRTTKTTKKSKREF